MGSTVASTWRARGALALALIVVAAFATAGPALADPATVGTFDGGASGVTAHASVLGSVLVNVPPTPSVTLPSDGTAQTNTILKLSVTNVVSADTLTVNTSGTGQGTSTGHSDSSAEVQGLDLKTILPLTATVVESTCTASLGNSSGTTTITGLSIPALPALSLALNPSPNTSFSLPGGIGTIWFNKQTLAPDHNSIDVRAIEIDINLPVATATVVVSESTCSVEPATVVPYGTIGGLALAGILGVAFVGRQAWVSRRRRMARAS